MHRNEAVRPLGEVWAFVALIREWNEGADGERNFRNRPTGGVEIIRANEFPNLVEVNAGSGWNCGDQWSHAIVV